MAIIRILLLLVVAASLISSDPALAAKKKKIKRAPGDIAFSRTEKDDTGDKTQQFPPAVFQHWRHVAQYRCYVCHSAVFEMQQSEGLGERMHKSDMCGSCHDGEPAFAISLQTCHRCHVSSAADSGDKKKRKKKKKDAGVKVEKKVKENKVEQEAD